MQTLDLRPVSRLFKALGDENRLRIVGLLSQGELCVCHLQAALGSSQPNVSRHLAVLRAAGVVSDRREGTWVYYQLRSQENPECASQLRGLIRSFGRRDLLRRDVQRLRKACGPGSCR